MIEFRLGNNIINTQIIPLYGVFFGVVYYNPNLEPDFDPVDEDDFFHQITFAFFIVGLHFTIWKL